MADEELQINGTPISSLRVVDLKKECDKRGLSKSGTKIQLIDRLKTQLLFENKDDSASGPTIQLEEEDCQNEFIKQYLAKQKQLIENAESSMNSSSQESDSEDSPKKQTKSPTMRSPPIEISPEKQPGKNQEVEDEDTANEKKPRVEETALTRHTSRRIARIELETSGGEKTGSSDRPSRRSLTRSSQSTGSEQGQYGVDTGASGDASVVVEQAGKTTEDEKPVDKTKKEPEGLKEDQKVTKAEDDLPFQVDISLQQKYVQADDDIKKSSLTVKNDGQMQTSSDLSEEEKIQASNLPKEDTRQTTNEFKINNNQAAVIEDKMQTSSEATEGKMQMSNESTKGLIKARAESKEENTELSTELKARKVRTSSELKEDLKPPQLSKEAAANMEQKLEPGVEMSIMRSGRSGRTARQGSSSSSSRSRSPPQQRQPTAARKPLRQARSSSSSSSSSRSRSRSVSPRDLKTNQHQSASLLKQPQKETTASIETEGQRSRSESSRSRSPSPSTKMETEPVQRLSYKEQTGRDPSKESSSTSSQVPEMKQAKKISLNRRPLETGDKAQDGVEDRPAVKRRKWGSQTMSAGLKPRKTAASISISTDSLKELIPEISPSLKLSADPILEDEMDYEDDTDHEDPALSQHKEETDTRAVHIQRTVTQDVGRKASDDDKTSDDDSDGDSDKDDEAKNEVEVESEAARSKSEEREAQEGVEKAAKGTEEQEEGPTGDNEKDAAIEEERMETEAARLVNVVESASKKKVKQTDLPANTSPTKKTKKDKKDRNKEIKVIRRLESGAATLITADEPERPARSPSPARNPVTKIVHIRNLVRPFTLHQLKELLGRYGTLIEEDFWIDKIKSHCFASYATVEEAENTRRALHNTRWPQSNPKTLTADFAAQDQLDSYRGVTKPKPAAPAVGKLKEGGQEAPKERPSVRETHPGARDGREKEMEARRREREQRIKEREEREKKSGPVREWDRDKKSREDWDRTLQKSRSRSRDNVRSPSPRARKADRDRGQSAEKINRRDVKKDKKEDEPPAKLLDDLFKKTKTAPCIYWLPLTELQVQAREKQGMLKPKLRQRSVAGDLHSPIRDGGEIVEGPSKGQGSEEREKARARNPMPDSRRPEHSLERRQGGSPSNRRHRESSPLESSRRRDSSPMESARRRDSSPIESSRRKDSSPVDSRRQRR